MIQHNFLCLFIYKMVLNALEKNCIILVHFSAKIPFFERPIKTKARVYCSASNAIIVLKFCDVWSLSTIMLKTKRLLSEIFYYRILTRRFCRTAFLSPTVSNLELRVHSLILSINSLVAVPFQKQAALNSLR